MTCFSPNNIQKSILLHEITKGNMTVLDLQQLKDKSITGIRDVEMLSFEYMLAGISKEYCIAKEYKTIEDFNCQNELNLSKISLFPFFVSLSNGHSESLFSLFGDFYALSFGPIALDIFMMIKDKGNPMLQHFTVCGKNPLGVEVINMDDPCRSAVDFLQSIQNKIKNALVVLEGFSVNYEELIIKSDKGNDRQLFLAIESGIKAIKDQSNNFFSSEARVMKFHASYFEAYKKRFKENDLSRIDFSEVEDGAKRPFYKAEQQ